MKKIISFILISAVLLSSLVSCQVMDEKGGLIYDYVGRYIEPENRTPFTPAEINQKYKVEPGRIHIITTYSENTILTVAGAFGAAHDKALIENFGTPWAKTIVEGRPTMSIVGTYGSDYVYSVTLPDYASTGEIHFKIVVGEGWDNQITPDNINVSGL